MGRSIIGANIAIMTLVLRIINYRLRLLVFIPTIAQPVIVGSGL
jgi:hypothetical protein